MREQCACSFDKIGLTGEFVLDKGLWKFMGEMYSHQWDSTYKLIKKGFVIGSINQGFSIRI